MRSEIQVRSSRSRWKPCWRTRVITGPDPTKRSLLLLTLLAIASAPFTCAAETAVAPAPALQSTTEPSDQNYAPRFNYQVYFNDYLTLKQGQPVDLIFIGDSITEQWRWGAGWPVWQKHFEARALDFGPGSDRTQHTVWRLQNIDLSGFKPKVAVIMIGTNNRDDTPEDIAKGVKAVIAATQAKFAGIKIVLMSILPNARATEKMATANTLIARSPTTKPSSTSTSPRSSPPTATTGRVSAATNSTSAPKATKCGPRNSRRCCRRF